MVLLVLNRRCSGTPSVDRLIAAIATEQTSEAEQPEQAPIVKAVVVFNVDPVLGYRSLGDNWGCGPC